MARMPGTLWVTCGGCCLAPRRLLGAFPQRSSRRRRQKSGGDRRSKRECTIVQSAQKNESVRKWSKGRERRPPLQCGTGRLRSQKSGQIMPTQSQGRSLSRRGHRGCLSSENRSLHPGKNQWLSQSPEKSLSRPLWKCGRSLWKNTEPRAHASSELHRPRSGVAGHVLLRGGHAVHAGGGPHTMEGTLLPITAGVPTLVGTGGVILRPQQGPALVPLLHRVQAMVLSRRPTLRSSKRSRRFWRSWANARTLCSKSGTTGPKAGRSLAAVRMKVRLLLGGKGEATRLEAADGREGVAADGVAQHLPLVLGPPCHRRDAGRDQALHVEGRIGVHLQGIATNIGEA